MESVECQNKQFGICQLGNGEPQNVSACYKVLDKEMLLNMTNIKKCNKSLKEGRLVWKLI